MALVVNVYSQYTFLLASRPQPPGPPSTLICRRDRALANGEAQLPPLGKSVRPSEHDNGTALRRSAVITRKLRQLRAHGLIKKVPKTHRYMLTEKGREIITSLMAARCATAEMLMKAA